MLLLFGFAFLSGLVTILAPCIWPLLPVILSSTMVGKGHKRPLGITLGIMVSFAVFTLSLSYLAKVTGFDPNNLRLLAVIVMVILGLVMLIPKLSELLEGAVSRLTSYFGRRGQSGSGFGGGFVAGLSLGVVWSPCAGPILATIAALAATGKVTTDVVGVTIAYVIGVGIPLFIFAYGGQKLLTNSRALSPYTARIQQIFGLIMIVAAIGIYTNYDKVIEADLLNVFPSFSSGLTGFENSTIVTNQLNSLKGANTTTAPAYNAAALFNVNVTAPEITGITHWLNSNGETIAGLKGKVVLVDFWTYTCINCIRTLPYVTSWYDKYHDQGFVVLGIHTPEFEFEKDTNNVAAAIKRFNIHYPVGQDNDYSTWNAFSNEYWPAEYLIDANGTIRRVEFGEGEYDKMEEAIQMLLAENGHHASSSLTNVPGAEQANVPQSPETYLGSNRMEYYYPLGHIDPVKKNFTLTDSPALNSFSYGGTWDVQPEEAVAGTGATLVYHFTAGKVYLVMRPSVTKSTNNVKVFIDGKPADATNAGSDVKNGTVHIDSDRLYNLVDLHGKPGAHILRLEFDSGIQAFAFTFGS